MSLPFGFIMGSECWQRTFMACDIKFKHPCTSFIGGPTGLERQRSVYVSCKTSTPGVPHQIFQLELYGVTVNGVPCLGSWLGKNEQIHDGVPENFENAQAKPCVILDLLNEVYSRAVCDFLRAVTTETSVILITQNVFHHAPHCRDISLKIFGIYKKTFAIGKFAYLARQVLPEASASLCDAYREATQNPHGYMISDCPGYRRSATVSNQCLSVWKSSHYLRSVKGWSAQNRSITIYNYSRQQNPNYAKASLKTVTANSSNLLASVFWTCYATI
jgi:hypothetical protein